MNHKTLASITLMLLVLLMSFISWQLCFEANGFGGWLPFMLLAVGPIAGWAARGVFECS